MEEDLKTQHRVEQQLDHNDQEENITNHDELDFEQQETILNGRLTIKLKISKPESGEEQGKSTSIGNEKTRVCETCNKGFSNGKALGGHMRMHYQEQKTQNQKLALGRKNHKSTDFGNNVDLISPVCYVCHKEFRSMKSLFGHMRSHPQRDWRGINPPPNSIAKNSTSSSTLSDSAPPTDQPLIAQKSDHDHQNDSVKFDDVHIHDTPMPKWSFTGKRGRKGKSSSAFLPGLEDRLNQAVHELMTLASSNPNPSYFSNHYAPKSEVTLPHRNSENKTQIFDSLKRIDKGKEIADLESDDEFFTENFLPLKLKEEYSDTQNSKRCELGSSKKKARRKLKLDELEETDYDDITEEDQMKKKNSVRCGYRCSICVNLHPTICNRTFPTHQALGGHMASHNKNKRIQNKNWAKSSTSAMEEHGTRETSQTGLKVVLNFDLNDLPPVEDEQGN